MKKKYLCLQFILLLFMIPCFWAAKDVNRRHFLNYGPTNNVQAVRVQGDNLWIATTGGLVHFNRSDSSFTFHQMSDGLPGHLINDLEFDATGTLWIATNNGIGILENGHWTIKDTTAGLPSERISCIAKDEAGNLWFGTKKGICTPDKDGWKIFDTANSGMAGNDIRDLDFDAAGRMWVACHGGLSEYSDGRWKNYGIASFVDGQKVTAPDSNRIYFAQPNQLIYRTSTGWRAVSTNQGTLQLASAICYEDADHVWIGNPSGLQLFENERVLYVYQPDLPGLRNDVQCICRQSPDLFWVGFPNGLAVFNGKNRWTQLKWDEPLPITKIRGLGFAGERLCAGTENGMFYRKNHFFKRMHWSDGDSIQSVSLIEPVDYENFLFVTPDFMGRNNGEILEKVVSLRDCPVGSALSSLLQGKSGEIYCGSAQGLVALRNGSWTDYSKEYEINDIIGDNKDRIWLATNAGVIEYDPLNSKLHLSKMRKIFCGTSDQSGNLWVGSDLYFYMYDRKWKKIKDKAADENPVVKIITLDSKGNIYGLENGGFFVFDGKKTFVHYSLEDGLVNDQINCILAAKDGSVWFGTEAGISCLLPE